AVEMTNDELCEAIEDCPRIEASARSGLKEVLQRSTLVKFAKNEPDPVENETSFDRVEEFLKAMKQAAETAEKDAAGKNEAGKDATDEKEAPEKDSEKNMN
ncbi:MAG: hypothetical protein K2I83_04495, partial [Bacteroidales bacterium]|nr:hypothetical protein [Bacteroidales bacterium]